MTHPTDEHWFRAPDRLEADGFVLRSFLPGDGVRLNAAVVASYEHLAPWMPWPRADQTDEEAERTVCRMRARYLQATDFTIGVFSPDESEVWGGSGFHLRHLAGWPTDRPSSSGPSGSPPAGQRSPSRLVITAG